MAAQSVPKSRLTAQGQISIPAEIRKRLGIVAGSTLEWHEWEGAVVIRKSEEGLSFHELHLQLFPDGPPAPVSVKETDVAISDHLAKKYGPKRIP